MLCENYLFITLQSSINMYVNVQTNSKNVYNKNHELCAVKKNICISIICRRTQRTMWWYYFFSFSQYIKYNICYMYIYAFT